MPEEWGLWTLVWVCNVIRMYIYMELSPNGMPARGRKMLLLLAGTAVAIAVSWYCYCHYY
jgi:hypothetical protein